MKVAEVPAIAVTSEGCEVITGAPGVTAAAIESTVAAAALALAPSVAVMVTTAEPSALKVWVAAHDEEPA